MTSRTAAFEADLAALRQAADRAGTALACLFSNAEEYEAALIKERRAAGWFRPKRASRLTRALGCAALATVLIFV
ncbi:MAG: hypothetical protein J0H62_06555 [Rhizobiales bacterium]|nr:hypothetical protein [Hyphomicrobiales bacterium]